VRDLHRARPAAAAWTALCGAAGGRRAAAAVGALLVALLGLSTSDECMTDLLDRHWGEMAADAFCCYHRAIMPIRAPLPTALDLAIDLVVTACQSPERVIGFYMPRNERGFIGKFVRQFMRDADRGYSFLCYLIAGKAPVLCAGQSLSLAL